jgi:hypothetical protein
MIRRLCICEKPIQKDFALCKECRKKYGIDRSLWPEWVDFLVSENLKKYRDEIERKEMSLGVAEYLHCKHFMITRPTEEAAFGRLRFWNPHKLLIAPPLSECLATDTEVTAPQKKSVLET